MNYEILLGDRARQYISGLDDKSTRIVKDNLRKLEDDPHPRPGSGSGDKERLTIEGEDICRLHIGRTHTAFYVVDQDEGQVRVFEVLPIDEAHDRYGEL